VRLAITRFIAAALVVTLMAGSARAQGVSGGGFGGGGRKQHQQKADKPDTQKPKVDDKAYNAALKSLPNKPYDPWHGAR
jgi:hypothetical protein